MFEKLTWVQQVVTDSEPPWGPLSERAQVGPGSPGAVNSGDPGRRKVMT